MARCCGSVGTCACRVEAGRMMSVVGTGTPQDPIVIGSELALSVEDTATFHLTLAGTGTLSSPWLLSVSYADEASLNDLPDVNVTGTPPGYVLAWDYTNQEWSAAPPTTAAPGVIIAGNGVDGDGSAPDPLVAVGNAARYISVTASGIGLNDAGINSLIRVFATEAARTAASPVAVQNTLSILETNPTVIDLYDGSDWFPITGGIGLDIQAGELLALSGSYVAGGATTKYVSQVNTTTDSTGAFVVIPSGDLATYSGVLSCIVQPVGDVGWACVIQATGGIISGVAYRLDTGGVYSGYTLTAVVDALLY